MDKTKPPSTKLSPNAKKVLERRYLKKNEDGKVVETPEDMLRRVASNIAQADLFYTPTANIKETEEKFFNMMARLEFMPNSPTLMNAGRDLQQLSACFVLPIGDSMEEIFTAVKDTALIHKSGGGTGFSFSRLRPSGSRVATTSGVSSGPISFMKVFDSATEAIKQGGTRRGANMGILRIDHPDIEEFIVCKRDDSKFNNFNISVAITEDFMRRVENDDTYELINPHSKEVVKKLSARMVFETIVESAWKNGDPGIIFIDRINRDNPTPAIGEIESTNPCGEQPLLPYESCNLGSINLAKMVKKMNTRGQGVKESSENKNPILEPSNPRTLEPFQYEIDWDKLKDITWKSVHFLDNVIDMNRYPLKKIEMMTKANRKIGLGVMGFADMLIEMGVSYNSNRAIQLAEEVMSFIDRESKMASADLAKTRGTFPNFKGSRWDEDFENNGNNYPYKGLKIRNATTTTIAPTGTISIIAGCSSGVEPLFAVSYIRTVMDKDELVEVHPYFDKIAKERNFYSERLMKEIAKKGHICDMPEIPEDICKIFVTSHNIAPDWHIKMQAVFQKYTDNAVSKTVNFKFAATQDDVKKAYVLAYKLGCKGVTIYRDGSRDEQVLSTGDTKKKEQKVSNNGHEKIVPRPRPEITRGTTHRVGTGCGNLYVTINVCDEGKPFEIFTRMGKAGGCAASQSEAIGRLVSLSLRSGIEPDEIVKQLMGISCHMPAWENGNRVLSCSDAISKAIGRYLSEVGAVKPANQTQSFEISVGACPDCGSSMEQADGCLVCRACGYSKCS
ncbi:MAG TPA: ribonucleotide-diphosphate reductase subunit alpha [Nitrospinae bacterium]|nr:ribonucleotide-diphosphate reductase subunit alpha [Nitrospinota bacterium]HBA25914.1 ribonucleotide-diphosphate reductase subunit alpha [Nitrospinota bacterium]